MKQTDCRYLLSLITWTRSPHLKRGRLSISLLIYCAVPTRPPQKKLTMKKQLSLQISLRHLGTSRHERGCLRNALKKKRIFYQSHCEKGLLFRQIKMSKGVINSMQLCIASPCAVINDIFMKLLNKRCDTCHGPVHLVSVGQTSSR